MFHSFFKIKLIGVTLVNNIKFQVNNFMIQHLSTLCAHYMKSSLLSPCLFHSYKRNCYILICVLLYMCAGVSPEQVELLS